MSSVMSWRTVVRQFVFILLAAFSVAAIFVLVFTRSPVFHDLERTGTAMLSLTVIHTESRTCAAADVNRDSDRKTCRPLLNGDPIPLGRPVRERPHNTSMTSDNYVQLAADDCNCFRSRLGYYTSADTSAEERAFPIAFSLLTYENLEQTERLLRLTYRPHNVYCVHVDRKSDPAMHRGMEAVASCLPNVIIARPSINVTWGEITVVQAEVMCMGYLLAYSSVQWKYFINLVARDFPLRTNEELVSILKAYGGANDIRGTRTKWFYPAWFEFQWKNWKRTGKRKSPPPHGFVIAKGSAHIAATREFIQHALTDRKALDLLDWMSDIKVPDEHYFQTLNHNPNIPAPGSFHGDPDSKMSLTRAKHWLTRSHQCSGRWLREVCNVGLPDLPWVIAAPMMFLNKIRLEDSPLAYRCLEQWYRDRVAARRRHLANRLTSSSSSSLADLGYRFNLTFYSQQSFVRQRHLTPATVTSRVLTDRPLFSTIPP